MNVAPTLCGATGIVVPQQTYHVTRGLSFPIQSVLMHQLLGCFDGAVHQDILGHESSLIIWARPYVSYPVPCHAHEGCYLDRGLND